jgi:hypothetical protein
MKNILFKIKNVILTGRTEYNQIMISKLKSLVDSCDLSFIKFENTLDQHFNRVLNEIEPPSKVSFF